MKYAIIAAMSFGFVGSALAAEGPTMTQCKGGWKAEYSKMWTEADFKTACDKLMMEKK
jgi:hypothetical protein